MFNIMHIFSNDLLNLKQIDKSIEDEAKGKNIPSYMTKSEYKKHLDTQKDLLKEKLQSKSEKIELYVIGISFIILTGLVTNQLYTSALFSFKETQLAWGGFFIGHIFVVASFVLLMLFGIEIAKVFIVDDDIAITKEFLIVPAILIPLFSQINSAMINIESKYDYTQVGFSSIIIGLILVKYILFDMLELHNKLKPIFGYKQTEYKFSKELSLGDM